MAGTVGRVWRLLALSSLLILFFDAPPRVAAQRVLWERDGLAGREVRALTITAEPRSLVALTSGNRDGAPLWRRSPDGWARQAGDVPALELALAALPEGGLLLGAGRDLADAPGVFWLGGQPPTARRLYQAQAVGALAVAPDPSGAPSTVYAATAPWADRDPTSTVLRHDPSSDDWSAVLRGALTCEGTPSAFVQLVTAPSDPASLLALERCMGPTSRRTQLWRSADRGETWRVPAGGDPGALIVCVAFDPGDARVVFRAIADDAPGAGSVLQRSTDGGESWTTLGAETGSPPTIRALLFDPRDPRRIIAGTEHSGAYLSLDGGESWQPLPGLEPLRIWSLAVDAAEARLYAGTADGVWRMTLP